MTMNRQSPEKKAKRYYKVKAALTDMGYQLLTPVEDYKGNLTPLHTICPNGHETTTKTWSNYQRGRQCRECFSLMTISKGEIEVAEFVKECIPQEVITNDRTTIINSNTGHYLEFDIWIPELNKAIEFNGVYWHSRFSDNDGIKIRACEDKGISLMVIWDTDWADNTDMVKMDILQFLHNTEHEIRIKDNEWLEYYRNWTPSVPEKYYRLTSPDGEIFELFKGGLVEFCTEHALSYSSLIQGFNGYSKGHKGWLAEYINEEDRQRASDNGIALAEKNKTGTSLRGRTIYVTCPDGNVHEVSNIKQFCREHGLSHSTLGLVAKGVRKSHKGYTACVKEKDECLGTKQHSA